MMMMMMTEVVVAAAAAETAVEAAAEEEEAAAAAEGVEGMIMTRVNRVKVTSPLSEHTASPGPGCSRGAPSRHLL